MAAQVGSRCTSRSSAGSSNTGTRSSPTPGALGPGCWRETLTHRVTPARASSSGPAAARALPRKSDGATRTNGGGSKTRDMEGGYSSGLCHEVPNAYSSEVLLEGRGGEPAAAAEGPGTLESSRLFTKRDFAEAPEEEEEKEEEGSLRNSLKRANIQLVQGVQEWQDGCVYRGEFGLDMKLGYGEFSWPTGESYHGQFYRDHCHGSGTYTWPDGSSFTGTFYLSCREGYGTMCMKTRLFQVHCHTDVVNLLLDHGADVNKCSDEGLTPLNMCFLLYYPAHSFKPNIAERTVTKPQEAPKLSKSPSHSFSFSEVAVESLSYEESVPTRGSQDLKAPPVVPGSHEGSLSLGTRQSWEATNLRSSLQQWESTSPRGSTSDAGKRLDDVPGNLDACSLGSNETAFESNLCVHSFSIELSQAIMEKSARAHSMLKAPSLGTTNSDKGTMRQMALSMIEHRNRWLTINLLLHRGADPNCCGVPMQVLFFAVRAGDVDGVKLLLENGARTDIQLPAELWALTPLHIAAALPGEEGVQITELLLHAITDVDARAADENDVYRPDRVDMLPSNLKLNNEAGPASIYYSERTAVSNEGGRTALHVACEREDNHRIVKELLSQGADPNLLLTKGLGSALCVACNFAYENQRNMDSKLALIDLLINYGADILKPIVLMQGDKVAVGTAVDYGYFRFYQDRKIAHCPFHSLMPAERETFLARKRLLEYMGIQLRQAVFAKESQWDLKRLYLSKRAELMPSHRLKRKSTGLPKALQLEDQGQIPFFKFCYQCGRSIGVRLVPCTRCYGILTCSKYCKTKAWTDFHKKDCSALAALGAPPEDVCLRVDESH
uniref:Ankyrin repeat and MYND domain containing 1 n=1 Tax=Equus asinus TaxID=9793 RepID=A0A8C4LNE1_EQUAS